MSKVQTKRYTKNPLYVDAVRITRRNFSDVVRWCRGTVQTETSDAQLNPGKKYIKIDAHNPINARQTKAFIGDFVLKTDRGFKVYALKNFLDTFTEFEEPDVEPAVEYPRMDGDFIVIGPECFALQDGSLLSWKGVNYVIQNSDQSVEALVAAEQEKVESEEDAADKKEEPTPSAPGRTQAPNQQKGGKQRAAQGEKVS